MIPESHVSPEELVIRQTMELRVAIWLKEKLYPTPMLLTDARRGRPAGLTSDQIREVIRLLEQTTLTHREVGEATGMSSSMVSSIGIVVRALHAPNESARVG